MKIVRVDEKKKKKYIINKINGLDLEREMQLSNLSSCSCVECICRALYD